MKFARTLKISTSLYLLFGIAAILLSAQALSGVFSAVQQQRQAVRAEALAAANRDLFLALQVIRQERGPVRVALGARDAADPQFLVDLPRLRARAQPALEALLAACSRVDCAAGDQLAAIRGATQQVVALRTEVDAAMRVPLAARPAGIAKQWNDASTALVDDLENLSRSLTGKLRMLDPIVAELIAIKEASYVVRDAAGLERNDIQLAMAAQSIAPDVMGRMMNMRGKVDAGWRLLSDLIGRPGVPATILAAVKAADAGYFGSFVKQRTAIEQALAKGAKSPLTDTELVRDSNTALDIIVAIPMAALDAVVEHVNARARRAATDVLLQSALLIVSLGVAVLGFGVAWRRVARPINVISSAMNQVAEGDLAVEVPFRERGDEVGRLARALEVFKHNAVVKRQIETEQAAERQQKEQHAQHLAALTRDFGSQVAELVQSLSMRASEMETTAQSLSATAEQASRQATAVAAASEQTSTNVQTVASATEELSASRDEIGRQIEQ
jgi:methyl-accepting chemotaxis protein